MAMKKNYNYTRRKLYLPEYGRHIHEMVDSLLDIEDRHERTRQAKAVIAVMGNINPLLRDTEDFKHKLWDHLFIMSDFRLDVDSPYAQPSRQDLTLKPKKMHYPQSHIMFKHYGKYVRRFVRTIASEPTTDATADELANVARFMRTKSYEYNNEHPNNDAIIRDIRVMAGGDINIDLSYISSLRSEYRPSQQHRNLKRVKTQRGSNQRKAAKPMQKSGARHNGYR